MLTMSEQITTIEQPNLMQRMRENMGLRGAAIALSGTTLFGSELATATPVTAEAAVSAESVIPMGGPTYRECKEKALTMPSDLLAKYVTVDGNRYRYVNTTASLPNMTYCDNKGKRVFRLKNIEVQRADANGVKHWLDALDDTVRLAYGNSAKSIDKTVKSTENIYCYKSPSKSDGVSYSRATYQLKFVPTNPDRAVARHNKTVRIKNPNLC
jgi:hypothetical protein